MRIIAADVGNSSIKLARASWDSRGETITTAGRCTSIDPGQLRDRGFDFIYDANHHASHWFVSSVNPDHARALRALAAARQSVAAWREVTVDDIDLEVDVENPRATGIDRLLAAQAAKHIHAADRDVIVIDCGTAMTIDLVTRDNTFRGGVILAGPETSLRALASMTASLPDLSGEPLVRPASIPARSTRDAMLAGTWLNGLGAIRETVARISNGLDEAPRVVGTGGGLDPWRDDLPQDWTVVENLVIEGLFQVVRRELAGNRAR